MRPTLLALVLLACGVHPLIARLSGTHVGAYDMFTAPRPYRFDIDVDGKRLSPENLAASLGPDARRVLLGSQPWKVGEANASLIPGAIPELAALACRVVPQGRQVKLRLRWASPSAAKSWAIPCLHP